MYKLLDNKIVYMVSDEVKGEVDFNINGDIEYLEENNYKIKCSCSYAKKWAIKNGKIIG